MTKAVRASNMIIFFVLNCIPIATLRMISPPAAAIISHRIFLEPDDMLKAALRLKDALVLRCGGMSLRASQDEKGKWLQIIYCDDDVADVGERFRLHTPAQRRLFALRFLPLHNLARRRSRRRRINSGRRILSSPDGAATFGKCARRSSTTRAASATSMNCAAERVLFAPLW